MTHRHLVLVLTALATVALGAIWMFRAAGVTDLDPYVLANDIRSVGILGPVAVLLVFVLQCVIAPIPSEPVMLAAGFVYGPVVGFGLAWLGVVLGAAACFCLSRRFGRPLVERLVHPRHLDALDAYVEQRGYASLFALLIAIRVLAFTSFDAVSYGCGLTRFPVRSFVVATAVGVVPKAFALSYAGATAAARPAWIDAIILVGSFGILFIAPWLMRGHRRF